MKLKPLLKMDLKHKKRIRARNKVRKDIKVNEKMWRKVCAWIAYRRRKPIG